MDLILIVLLGLLFATLLAFILGIIPYPFGLIVLTALIAARILYLRGPREPR
jgi:dihydroxy-acid dehydratase